MTEYHNQIGKVPIGDVYEGVTVDIGTISKGDVIVWEDPDIPSYHDENVHTSLFVGFVEKVYEFNSGNEHRDSDPQLGVSCPLGRLSIDNNLKAISGMQIYHGDKADMKFVDRFLNSNYDKYMNVEYTMSGDIQVSGE